MKILLTGYFETPIAIMSKSPFRVTAAEVSFDRIETDISCLDVIVARARSVCSQQSTAMMFNLSCFVDTMEVFAMAKQRYHCHGVDDLTIRIEAMTKTFHSPLSVEDCRGYKILIVI